MKQRIAVAAMAAFLAGAGLASGAAAQGPLPVEQMRVALQATAGQWIQFRNYDGREWVYFTGILAWKCGLKEIRYSVNGRDLGERFPIPACNPQLPLHLDPVKDKVYLTFPLGEAKTVSVQLVYSDGVESALRTYRPCNVEGDATCGQAVE